ncbi:PilZ-like domain-containing protein [Pelobacter propionicus]|uniref:Type IV pilus assembly PilZ n=1 Tax=Pelobacter propionicus (strain DSM 2379 / NBRC 103807 / OttBd1) TaxID=338966 RepID=A1AR25_PELPD|nr:PilZ-like domain-containing protein [Pelobacter propionicus]ABK99795.1 type IV pilus assembly PilZ [Pelobacter propionicus DSM 2379]
MSYLGDYASFFTAGMKVGVGIPLPNAETFLDWAMIYEVDEDLVILQLSRDQLPESVALHVGQILDLRGGKDDSAYSCRAIIVSEWRGNVIQLRLVGEIVTDELREFYRVDAFLPIKYYISPQQNPDVLRTEWAERHRQRLEDELLRKQQPWEVTFVAEDAELPPERLLSPQDDGDDQDPSWDGIIPLAANISGGGMRIVAHQRFQVGEYVPLEIMLPVPRRIVEAVGKVVFTTPNRGVAGDRESYSLALKFVFIDERDRDAIVKHIAAIQLQRIRQMRELFALRDEADGLDGGGTVDRFRSQRTIAYGAVLLAFLVVLVLYFREYAANHPKSVIGETFETGIRTYLERIGR